MSDTQATAERHEFQTEVKQLLDLMIHSLYSNQDVFLRELISNASDALDKIRFEGVSRPELLPEGELRVFLSVDEDARTLTVEDNGIGMSRTEVIDNIGTIARSGSKEFLTALKKMKADEDKAIAPELIGQFGVGFYASFMVAESVELVTRKAGETMATRWYSTGDGGYEICDGERAECGTTITLTLKPAEDDRPDYTSDHVIRTIVKRYSDFLSYPIKMMVSRPAPPPPQGEAEGDGEAEDKPSGGVVIEEETLNSGKAIWLRSKSEVTEDEHKEFYHHISHDWNAPLTHLFSRMEGAFDVRALLYVPSKAPFDLYHRNMRGRGVQLYVKRVFIMDDCESLLPPHLRFIKGVVDAEDLSLNVSREMLQQDRQIAIIRKHLVKKVEDALKSLRKDKPEDYLTFWGEFGPVMKEGLLDFETKKDRLLDLVLVESTHSDDELTGLDEYVERMPEEQEAIYYMTGPSRAAVELSPHIEAFRDKGYEVVFFVDRVDEVWLQDGIEYKGKSLVSIGKGEVELGSEEERTAAATARKEQEAEYGDLLALLRAKLQDDISEVRISSRLTSSPVCLVTPEGGINPRMEAIMRQMGQDVPKEKRILEVNPKHELLVKLHAMFDANPLDPLLSDYAHLLHGQAVLAEAGQLAEPAKFAKLIGDLVVRNT